MLLIPDAAAMRELGARLGGVLRPGLVVFLEGPLGAGKTTLVQGLLRALGIEGPIPSPTYTLLEPYEAAGLRLLHLDLYRLGDPDELHFLGLREELSGEAVLLVEWPERGVGELPPPDLVVRIELDATARRLVLYPESAPGRSVCTELDT